MTIKEISLLTNKTYKTICNWIESVKNTDISEKITEARKTSKPAEFTIDEVIEILRIGKVSEFLIDLLIENSKNKDIFISTKQNNSNLSSLNQKDIEIISTIVAMTVSKTIETLDKRIGSIENKFEERKALLPAPEKSDRENLNQFIRSYAHKNNLSHSVVWLKLYQEAYYRLNVNLKVNAYNRNLAIIDYADQEGYIPELLSIAIDIFK